jgi:hypothetical protein
MENLYSYVLWYNPQTETWYGIPRSFYTAFFAGSDYWKNSDGVEHDVLTANTVDALITTINKL